MSHIFKVTYRGKKTLKNHAEIKKKGSERNCEESLGACGVQTFQKLRGGKTYKQQQSSLCNLTNAELPLRHTSKHKVYEGPTQEECFNNVC